MPSKKGTKAKTQKQKQKQKQTVIVNINEKPKTRRKRKPTAPKRKPVGASSHIPVDAVRDILFQLSKGTRTPDSTITRTLTRPNPQAEILKDKADEATLPNIPPITMPENEAELIRLRAKATAQSPFSFSDAEQQTDDIHRFENKLIAPQTPLNAYLEQVSQHQTPIMHQPPPEIHIEEGPSGADAIGELDYNASGEYGQAEYDAVVAREPDAETAKDNQEIFDYVKSIGLSVGRTGREHQQFMERQREPTQAEKAGYVVAESRFLSPEAPEAFARPAVEQVESKKVNPNTDSRLQQADFRNVGEAQEAIKTWNGHQSKSDRIRLTKDTGGYKNLGDLELELASRQLSFAGMKAFQKENTTISPHIMIPRKVKGARLETALDGSEI